MKIAHYAQFWKATTFKISSVFVNFQRFENLLAIWENEFLEKRKCFERFGDLRKWVFSRNDMFWAIWEFAAIWENEFFSGNEMFWAIWEFVAIWENEFFSGKEMFWAIWEF